MERVLLDKELVELSAPDLLVCPWLGGAVEDWPQSGRDAVKRLCEKAPDAWLEHQAGIQEDREWDYYINCLTVVGLVPPPLLLRIKVVMSGMIAGECRVCDHRDVRNTIYGTRTWLTNNTHISCRTRPAAHVTY